MALAATDTCCLARTLAMASPRPLASPRPSPDVSGHEPVTFAFSLRSQSVPNPNLPGPRYTVQNVRHCSKARISSPPTLVSYPSLCSLLSGKINYSHMMQDQLMTSFVHKSSRGIHTITCSPHHYPTLGCLHVSCQIFCKNLFMLMLCYSCEMNSVQFEYCSLCKNQYTYRFLSPKYDL